jgi:hypothetical protein
LEFWEQALRLAWECQPPCCRHPGLKLKHLEVSPLELKHLELQRLAWTSVKTGAPIARKRVRSGAAIERTGE